MILRSRSSRSEAVSSRFSDLRLVSRPSMLVDSGEELVFVPSEIVFPAPCPFDGLPCEAMSTCFCDVLDSVDRYVVIERCRRYVAFFEASGGI